MTLSCPACNKEVTSQAPVWSRCESCRAMVFARDSEHGVVVAHESERIAARIGVVIAETGLWPLHAPNGAVAMRLIETQRPTAAVLDVALPEVMSFQIIERLRAQRDLSATKIVLVASIFNRTAYKRRPTSLYGADDYVEQHHVHDLLPAKLCALLQLPAPAVRMPLQAIDSPDKREELSRSERVRALARSIAADVALYHPDEVAGVVRGQTAARLETALEEGRRLLIDMVGGRPLGAGDPVAEAFAAIVTELRGGTA